MKRTILILTAFLLATRLHASAQPLNVVNVNTATVEQLTYLPGIGETLAGRIAGYTHVHPIHTLDELLGHVKGLGEAKLNTMRPYAVCSGPTTATGKIHAPRDSQRSLSLYSPAARQSIEAGLKSGTVHFEETATGGEYIYATAGH